MQAYQDILVYLFIDNTTLRDPEAHIILQNVYLFIAQNLQNYVAWIAATKT